MKISVITGKRGGFGAMVPLIDEFIQFGFHVEIILTDQHLDEKFGMTSKEVISRLGDRCELVFLNLNQHSDSPSDRAKAMGILGQTLTTHLVEHPPSFLVLYGDRSETLTSAVVATHLQIPIIHLQGGDKSGSVDDWMRHAISKLAHLHYPSTDDSKNRIIKLGEEPWRVETVGDSHLDPIIENDFMPSSAIEEKYGISTEHPLFVILQHSETTQPALSKEQMAETTKAISQFPDFHKVIIYPCSDVGYHGIVEEIEKFRGEKGYFVFENIEGPFFRTILRSAKVVIGNSSAGLIEAPSLGTPSVNIGRRQIGRLRGGSVIDCNHHTQDIVRAINEALQMGKKPEFSSPYSVNLKETSAKRIAQHLKGVMLREDLFTKVFYE